MPAPGVVTANLLVEHQFTGGGGSTVSDTSGNANTLTLGHLGSAALTALGTTHASPTWQSDGLLFDHTSETLATWADSSIVSESTTNFSAELWIKPITPVSAQGVYFNFGWDDHILQDGPGTSVFWPAFYTEYYRTGGASVTSETVQVTTPGGAGFSLNTWYQVVVTREPSTGKVATYINGIHQHDNYGTAFPFDTNGMALPSSAPDNLNLARTLGGDTFDGSFGDGVNALFGELRFYGAVLTDADVLQNYNARALAVTGSSPAAPRKPSSGLSGGMKPLMNGGLNG